jgi:hypothetical protein
MTGPTDTPAPDPGVVPATTVPDLDDLDGFADSVRAEITRHGGTLLTAVGIVVGAASACWSNPAGAGEFQSRRASVLVDVLLEYVTAAACACNTTEQRTHQRGDQGFCRLDRVSRSESED